MVKGRAGVLLLTAFPIALLMQAPSPRSVPPYEGALNGVVAPELDLVIGAYADGHLRAFHRSGAAAAINLPVCEEKFLVLLGMASPSVLSWICDKRLFAYDLSSLQPLLDTAVSKGGPAQLATAIQSIYWTNGGAVYRWSAESRQMVPSSLLPGKRRLFGVSPRGDLLALDRTDRSETDRTGRPIKFPVELWPFDDRGIAARAAGEVKVFAGSSQFAIGPDSSVLVVKAFDGRGVEVWTLHPAPTRQSTLSVNGMIDALDFSPRTGHLIVGIDHIPAPGQTIVLFDLRSGGRLCEIPTHPRGTFTRPTHPADEIVAINASGQLDLWSISTCHLIRSFR
jgi:hypothetical protein